MGAKFFDCTVIGSAEQALDFIGYEPEEVVGRANAVILHTEEDVAAGADRFIVRRIDNARLPAEIDACLALRKES